jgi:hypothetical protein
MNYLERLIRRALAVPRDTEQSLFDPFEQTAPWAFDENVAVRARAPAAENAHPDREPAVAAAHTATAPIRVGPPSPEAAKAAVPGTAEAAAQIIRVVEQALTPPDPAAARAGAAMPHEQSLATADAFMRSLDLKAPSRDAAARSIKPPPAAIPAAAARGRPTATLGQEPQRPGAAGPQTIQPVAPRPPSPSPPARAQPADRNASHARPEPAVRAHRDAAAIPQPSVITRTVVIARSPSRQLDDLAYSSGISRFGLGQG